MRCEELQPDYLSYAIGAAEEPERSEIRAHLDRGCATCTSGLREAQALTWSMGALLEGPAPPQELRARVLAIAAAQSAAPRRRSFWSWTMPAWSGVALAAACLALAAVPVWFWRQAVHDSDLRQIRQQGMEASLRGQLADVERGAALRALPIVPLELERSASTTPRQLTFPRGTPAVVFALPADLARQSSAADLIDSSGRIIRTVSLLPGGDSEAAGLTVAASLLPGGSYTVVLRAGERHVARFPFEVIWK